MVIKIGKIKKQIYRFELRKKFFNKKKYSIKKAELLDKLKNFNLAITPKQLSGFKKILLFFLFFAIFLWLISFFTSQSQPPYVKNESVIKGFEPQLNFSLLEGEIVSIGNHINEDLIAYIKASFIVSNSTNLYAEFFVPQHSLPTQIFILKSKPYSARDFQFFKMELARKLEEKGLNLNEISLSQLESLPQNSLLIIASGLLPEKLATDKNANLFNLLDRGVNIIYIGQRFDSEGQIIGENGEQKKPPKEFLEVLNNRFSFKPISNKPENLNMIAATYSVDEVGFKTYSSLLYNSVSLLKTERGLILFVPQTLDNGWEDSNDEPAYVKAANDIYKIITDFKWVTFSSINNISINFENNKEQLVFLTSQTIKDSSKNVFIRVVAENEYGKKEKLFLLNLHKTVFGDLFYTNPEFRELLNIPSTKVTEKDVSFIAKFKEPQQKKKVLYFTVFDIYGNSLLPPKLIGEGATGEVNLQGSQQFSSKLSLNRGTYIASIIDETQKSYAKALLKIEDLNFSLKEYNFDLAFFVFESKIDDTPIKVKRLKVTVDGKYVFSFYNQENFTINLKQHLGGFSLAPGNHTFRFEYGEGGVQEIIVSYNKREEFWENPLYWVLGTIALLLFIGSPFLAAMFSKVEYSLDIPDFPPLSHIKVPVKKSLVLYLFDKINDEYKWKYTPLTLEELKKGFKKITYNGSPIFISDYNLEYILEKLERSGDVKKFLDYYGLTKWEKESKKSLNLLSIKRKVRDICINEALPFYFLEDGADVYIKIFGQEIAIFIMELDRKEEMEKKIEYALKNRTKGITVFLFATHEDKKDFEDFLYSGSLVGTLLKLESFTGSINFLTISELEEMLKEMKTL